MLPAVVAALVAALAGCSGSETAERGTPAASGRSSEAAAAAAVPARWSGFPLLPDGRFPIAGWCAPPMDENSPTRMREYADAGFTVLLPAVEDPYAVQLNRERLRAAREAGLWAIVRDDRVHPDEAHRPNWQMRVAAACSAYADSAALLAYFLADEPDPKITESLAALTTEFARRDSLHPAYVNYLGLSPALKGHYGRSYRTYLEEFVTGVQPAFFSVDLYTLLADRETPNLCPGLDTARVVAQRHGVPFWAVLQLTPHLQFRDLTVGEISYQAMLALSYGAKGVVWFTYWTPRADEWGYRGGPISYQGRRNPSYQRVATVNRRLQQLGRLLGEREAREVRHAGELPVDGHPLDATTPLSRADGGPLTVGFFPPPAGAARADTLALLVSRDLRRPTRATLKWRGRAEIWDETKAAWAPYSEGDPALLLPPGGVRLLRFAASE